MQEKWNGFDCEQSFFEGYETIVVRPEKEKDAGRLALKTEYWDAFPNAVETVLVENGYTLCYIRNSNRWGVNEDLDRKARFVRSVQAAYGLKGGCVPVGLSCGGLIAIKFAARYPELVDCLYLDAPVLNYMSCPCGFGVGECMEVEEILGALKLESISELLCYRDMPMDHIPELVENKIPVVIVAGDSDKVVPYIENGILLEKAYKDAGLPIEVYIKAGCDHHPHGLEDNQPVVDFILRNCK